MTTLTSIHSPYIIERSESKEDIYWRAYGYEQGIRRATSQIETLRTTFPQHLWRLTQQIIIPTTNAEQRELDDLNLGQSHDD